VAKSSNQDHRISEAKEQIASILDRNWSDMSAR
jgi:hypothetical protein